MLKDLDPVLNQQIRLAIVSLLIKVNKADFNYLKEKTKTTQGNLSHQLKKLKEAEYINITKTFERNYPKANRFHYTITPDKQSAIEYRNRGINAEWINHFADTKVQFPMNLEPKYVAVTTRGIGNSEFLDYLTHWAEGAVGNRNGLGPKEHTEFLNSGMMVIQNSRWKEITRRIFEGMACGKMVLTDNLSPETGLRDMFIDGEDIVYYDDMFDCIEKMNYYNENEEERERIAHNGMMKVLHNYTQIQVVDKLIAAYERSRK